MLKPDEVREPFSSELIEIDGVPTIIPILGVQFGETALKLHYWNSTVLLFGNSQLNHVEYKGDGAKKGIKFDPDMIGAFREMHYPTYFRPFPDEATLEWYAKIQMAELERDIDQL